MGKIVIDNNKGDIKKIEVLSETLRHRNEHIGGHYFVTDVKVTYFNGIEEELRLYDVTCEEACKELKELCFKESVLHSLARFCEDAEYNGDEDSLELWEGLYNKVNSNLDLTEQDIEDINVCVRVCTVFDKFDYNTFIR